MALIEEFNKLVALTTFHTLLNNAIDPQTTNEFDNWLNFIIDLHKLKKINNVVIVALCEAAQECHDDMDFDVVGGVDVIVVNTNMEKESDLRKMALCKKVINLRALL